MVDDWNLQHVGKGLAMKSHFHGAFMSIRFTDKTYAGAVSKGEFSAEGPKPINFGGKGKTMAKDGMDYPSDSGTFNEQAKAK